MSQDESNIQTQGQVIPIPIETEVKKSYLIYAMSVIISRALPDVRDGLKPVHRRILYAMNEIGLTHDKPYRKSAHVVGHTMAKYHPHGDAAIYDTLVRLSQDFSLRYPVIQGQGNFGSIDGDPPAALRYTEARLMRLTQAMVQDLDKDVVDYGPNYDNSAKEPAYLPAKFPFLLTNGGSGIAVGMATNLAPHNLKEVCSAIIATIENPDIMIGELIEKHIHGPDFPTAALIYGKKGIYDAFTTGRGQVPMRGRYHIEEKKNRTSIIITEIPYLVNKANMVVSIADRIRSKDLEGIADLRDESNRMGIRIVLDLKKNVDEQVVVNYLFKYTDLQKNFNVNNLVLVDGLPKCLGLKALIEEFIKHRLSIVTRRTQFSLRKARAREHILQGFLIVLASLDAVIKTIRESYDSIEAKDRLIASFLLSKIQAEAVLEMRLHRLTGLEVQKVQENLQALQKEIKEYERLLSDDSHILEVIKKETQELCDKFGDARRTEIVSQEIQILDISDLIAEEPMALTFSYQGYINRIPLSEYRLQARGGKGSNSATLRQEDVITNFFTASTHDYVLFFTNKGKAYSLKVYEIVEGRKSTRGKHIRSFLELSEDEFVTRVLCLREFTQNQYAFLATAAGQTIRIATYQFRNARRKGIAAITLKDGDALQSVMLTDGQSDVLLVTKTGYALMFGENNIRITGRKSQGVRGIRLRPKDALVEVLVLKEGQQVIFLTERGYGKRFDYKELKPHGRGTLGQISYKTTPKTGDLIGAESVYKEHEILCITESGKTIKVSTKKVSKQKKTAMGVRVFNIAQEDKVIGLASADAEPENSK